MNGWAVGDGSSCEAGTGTVPREDVVHDIPPGHPTNPQTPITFYDMREVPQGGWQMRLYHNGTLLQSFDSENFGRARGFSKCWEASIVPGGRGTDWPDGLYWVEFWIWSALAGVGQLTLPAD